MSDVEAVPSYVTLKLCYRVLDGYVAIFRVSLLTSGSEGVTFVRLDGLCCVIFSEGCISFVLCHLLLS